MLSYGQSTESRSWTGHVQVRIRPALPVEKGPDWDGRVSIVELSATPSVHKSLNGRTAWALVEFFEVAIAETWECRIAETGLQNECIQRT